MSQLVPEPWGFPAGPYKAPPSRVHAKQVKRRVGQADPEGLSAGGMGPRASGARAAYQRWGVLWGTWERVGDPRSWLVPWESVLNAPVLRQRAWVPAGLGGS